MRGPPLQKLLRRLHKVEAEDSSSRYFPTVPSVKIKAEAVSAVAEAEVEADDEREDTNNWVGWRQPNFSRSTGQNNAQYSQTRAKVRNFNRLE